MAVTFDANATSPVTAAGVTSLTSSNLTIGAGANRAVIAQIVWSNSGGVLPTGVTVNWDQLGTPQAMALIPSATGTVTAGGFNLQADQWGLVAPTSGAKQLKVAWTNSNSCLFNMVSWTGVDQTGGATSFPHGTTANTTGVTTVNVVVTSAVGNAVMAVENSNASFSATGNTQTFLNNTNTSGAGERAAGAATVTCTWTAAGTNGAVGVGSDILASSGGGTNPTLYGMVYDQTAPRLKRVTSLTFVNSSQFQLLAGQDLLPFRGEVSDQSLPQQKRWPSDRTFVNPTEIQLIGQDTFFGLAGYPNFDWPNPKPLKRTTETSVNLVTLTVAGQDAMLPQATFSWPNPTPRKVGPPIEQQNILLMLLNVVVAGSPFALYDWPNPLKLKQTSITSYTGVTLNVAGQDAMPPAFGDQTPNPIIKRWKSESYQSIQAQLIGQDSMPPGGRWLQAVSPAKLWLSAYLQSSQVQLIGQDQLPIGQQFQGVRFSSEPFIDTFVPFNLVIRSAVIPPAGTNRFILVDGRLAMQISGMVYMFLD